jgi:NAD(P)-dependent dehydrogenase (short-subunit alcohol dehydrogenase family)
MGSGCCAGSFDWFKEHKLRLKDKIVIVTGGGRGMGAAYSAALAREGAKVVVNYATNAKAADEIVGGIRKAGGQADSFKADVGNKAEVQRMVDFAVEKYGRLAPRWLQPR